MRKRTTLRICLTTVIISACSPASSTGDLIADGGSDTTDTKTTDAGKSDVDSGAKVDSGTDAGPATVDAGTDAGPATVDAGADAGPATCATAGCAVDATCAETPDGPACTCKPGYSGDGKTCTDIDDCAADPCQNGGKCMDGVDSFTCVCPEGTVGASCEVAKPTFLWLDATDAASITKNASNKVTEWRDKSGLGRNAKVPILVPSTAPVWTANAVNGLPAVTFNGSTVRLATAAVPTASEMTIFVAFKMVSPQQWGSLLNQAHDTYFSIRKSEAGGANGKLSFHIQNDNDGPALAITSNAWKVLTTVRQGTTSTMYYEQNAPSTRTADVLTGNVTNAACDTTAGTCITIGNAITFAQSMGGSIAEIRAYASALDAASRGTIESALKTKYAIP